MAGVRTLADARTRLSIITVVGDVDLAAITLTQVQSGIDASCDVAKSGTRYSATASEMTADARFCDEGNPQVYGASNYEATIVPYWYLDPATGAYAEADNATYEALRVKGTTTIHVLRDGPPYSQEWAVGDIYDAYKVISDNPQRPTDTGGYIKRTIPLAVQEAVLHREIVAGA